MKGALRLRKAASLVIFVLAACNSNGGQVSAVPPPGAATADASRTETGVELQACERRNNDAFAKLEQWIQRRSLWQHLAQFQKIADAHPGPLGHGNRDTGTAGYKASVDYVADLLHAAGYFVTIQQYFYGNSVPRDRPIFTIPGTTSTYEEDWFVARNSGDGNVVARADPPGRTTDGCAPGDFDGFTHGNVALLARSDDCDVDSQVANAIAAGAAAVILYDGEPPPDGHGHQARLIDSVKVPVIGVTSNAIGNDLLQRYRRGDPARVHVAFHNKHRSDLDYNVIAESPYGDAQHTIVVEGHLDSIYGAGMLDNASGSTTILDLALAMAKTPTRNHLRFIWFGGEEIGLLGSKYYVSTLTQKELRAIAFDVDVDVTATPNYDITIAAAANAQRAKHFPPNVVPQSRIGNDYFMQYFHDAGVIARNNPGGSNGTDSLSFAYAGVPNTGILTQQDCCKHRWETALWGGFLGNYEGRIPSHNGGCVDYPGRWCDNLDNNDPFVLELSSRAVAYVAFMLANRPHFPSR
jgi:hypothetical protein